MGYIQNGEARGGINFAQRHIMQIFKSENLQNRDPQLKEY